MAGVADRGWKRRFDELIVLPGGGKLFTLKDAIAWLAKEIPQSEQRMKQVQIAAHCVTDAGHFAGGSHFPSKRLSDFLFVAALDRRACTCRLYGLPY